MQHKNIEITKQLGDVPLIKCFPGQLNQVLLNLIANAIDAINEKGEIVIKTYAEGGQLKISVCDNGTGIPEAMKNKIFDPFFTTKPVGQGTGLGLSVSYGIIENHKGKINVKSNPGTGTEFIITLPLS